MNKIFHINSRGFTLIELLVVVAIIGLLASIVLASLNGARAKGRDAKRLQEIHSIQTALELYRSSNGVYPYGCFSSQNANYGFGTSWSFLSSAYIGSMPLDPINTGDYGYYYCSYIHKPISNCAFDASAPDMGPTTKYILATKLENLSASSQSCPSNDISGWGVPDLNYLVGARE